MNIFTNISFIYHWVLSFLLCFLSINTNAQLGSFEFSDGYIIPSLDNVVAPNPGGTNTGYRMSVEFYNAGRFGNNYGGNYTPMGTNSQSPLSGWTAVANTASNNTAFLAKHRFSSVNVYDRFGNDSGNMLGFNGPSNASIESIWNYSFDGKEFTPYGTPSSMTNGDVKFEIWVCPGANANGSSNDKPFGTMAFLDGNGNNMVEISTGNRWTGNQNGTGNSGVSVWTRSGSQSALVQRSANGNGMFLNNHAWSKWTIIFHLSTSVADKVTVKLLPAASNAGPGVNQPMGSEITVLDRADLINSVNANYLATWQLRCYGGGNKYFYEDNVSSFAGANCSVSITPQPGACVPASNTYTLTGNFSVSNPPSGSLNITVSGGGGTTLNAPFPSTFSIPGLTADGAPKTVTATFSSNPSCSDTRSFTAPQGCAPAACSATLTATPGTCAPATNTYTLTGQVNITNPPSSGTLTIAVVGEGSPQTFNAPFNGSYNYTISGLVANGSGKTVSATFSANGSCSTTQPFSAPSSCTPGACSSSMTLTPGACTSPANNYALNGTISVSNGPASGTLTITDNGTTIHTASAPFSGPISFSASSLPANGATHTVVAAFSGAGACDVTQTYNAPASCQAGTCSANITTNVGTCQSGSNTYTLSGQIYLSGAPSSGTLTVSVSGGGSQVFNAPFSSPLSYSISGLNADGFSRTVSAVFSANGSCSTSSNFYAPASCAPVCSLSVTALPGPCSAVNYTYNVSGTLTFSIPPASGSLTVNISGGGTQIFTAPFISPLTYNITSLNPDAALHTVTAFFSAGSNCAGSTFYTAPSPCTPPPCAVAVTATPGSCDPETGKYPLSGLVSFSNPPTTGTLTVTHQGIDLIFNAPFSSPIAYTYPIPVDDYLHPEQEANGQPRTVTVTFSEANCFRSVQYYAPQPCPCTLYPPGVSTLCDDADTGPSGDDTYTVLLVGYGINRGTTYTLSGDLTGSFDYNSPTPSFGPFPISGGPVSYTITDNTYSGCTYSGSIDPPVPCSVLRADLQVVKTADKTEVLNGETVVYTVIVTNNGPDPANNVVIKDNLPAGVTYQSHNAPAGTTFNSVTGQWNIPAMTNGQMLSLTITVTVI